MRRLLLDQGLPRSSVAKLRDAGVDAVHAGDVGLSRATDSEILQYAVENDRVVVTLDADFHTMLALQEASSPSVVRIRIGRCRTGRVIAEHRRCDSASAQRRCCSIRYAR